MGNPFRPTFGVTPPVLVGRDEQIEAFTEALDDGPGAPGRAMLFSGARGTGKTVMLNALEDAARLRGWLVISQTARSGIAAEMRDTQIPDLLHRHVSGIVRHRLSGLTVTSPVGGLGVTRQRVDEHPEVASLRSRLELLTDALAEHDTGVLITIDELHSGARRDLTVITQTIQHLFREEREIAFLAAGLPHDVAALLDHPGTTFLRRAEHYTLTAVTDEQVREALQIPIEDNERTISAEALEVAAAGTRRYPFLIQLVGYHTWRADESASEITVAHAREGVIAATRRLGRLVHEPALNSLSEVDLRFLLAVAEDDGPSRMQDIARRLGVDASYAGQYRRRLIAAGLVAPAGYGKVDVAIPYLREHLRSRPVRELT